MTEKQVGSVTQALFKLLNRPKSEKLINKTKHILDFESYNRRVKAVNSFISANGLRGQTIGGIKIEGYIPTQPNAATFYKLIATNDKQLKNSDIPRLLQYEQAIKTFTELSNIIGEIKVPTTNSKERNATITIVSNASKLQKGTTLEDKRADIFGGTLDNDGQVSPFQPIDPTADVTVTTNEVVKE